MYDKKKFIKSYINEAIHWIELAEISIEKKKYNTVIRECQTAVELSIKALLFKHGLVVPKVHNLREELTEVKELTSTYFQDNYQKIYILANRLYSNREDSLYGDIDLNQVPEELFDKNKANKYLTEVKEVLIIIKEELKEFLK